MSVVDRINCDVPADWMNQFSQCLYEWQGLEAGLLAILAALLTAGLIWGQISQADRHEKDRLKRQHNAVRATLPLTLSGFIETVREMLVLLEQAQGEVRRDGFSSSFSLPETPSIYVEELKAVIASTDERSVAEPISEIIRQTQTLWARVQVLRDRRAQQRRIGLEREIDGWIIQAAQIHALIESLFDYARAETDGGPSAVAWERVESIIFQLGIERHSLVDRVREGIARSPNFWELR